MRTEPITTIRNILFPVDFSLSCVATAAFVKKEAAIFGARVTLVHVFDLYSHVPLQLYVRPPSEVAEEQRNPARDKLDSFLQSEFPLVECPRNLLSGDAASRITRLATRNGFDLITMATQAGLFRRALLGSTTAKVLNDADCPVLTTRHAETISLRQLEHRQWVCATDLSADSLRVLRYASQTAESVHANLTLVHVIPASKPDLPVELDLVERPQSEKKRQPAPVSKSCKAPLVPALWSASPLVRLRRTDRSGAQIAGGRTRDWKEPAARCAGSLAGSDVRNSP